MNGLEKKQRKNNIDVYTDKVSWFKVLITNFACVIDFFNAF